MIIGLDRHAVWRSTGRTASIDLSWGFPVAIEHNS